MDSSLPDYRLRKPETTFMPIAGAGYLKLQHRFSAVVRHPVAVAYRFGALYIKFIGIHAEYDTIVVETVEKEF